MHGDAQATFDRRRFLQIVGLGVSSSLSLPVVALAQTGGASPRPSKPDPASPAASTPPAAAPPAGAAPAAPPEISEDARSLAEIVRRRYGKHLTPEQLEAVTRDLDGRVQGGKRLRESKLANGDEPDFTFHA
jgi:hypothetical protein